MAVLVLCPALGQGAEAATGALLAWHMGLSAKNPLIKQSAPMKITSLGLQCLQNKDNRNSIKTLHSEI